LPGDDLALRAVRRRAIAALVRRFGADRFALAEGAVHDAFVRALERGLAPAAHEGWIVRVAYHVAIEQLRRERRLVAIDGDDHAAAAAPALRATVDDELALIFLCCHPSLPRAAQVALTLRVAYGFDTAQIARAYLSDERAIAQRIVRAKQRLRDEGARFAIPEPAELPTRLDAILDVVYQVFAEGHAPTGGDAGLDEALCAESLRIVRALAADPRTDAPEVDALRALCCFHVARAAARRADDGGLLLLHEQDRARWDRALLDEGFAALARSARGDTSSRFHLEAGIAGCHAAAARFADTDWAAILFLYDQLRACAPSPVVEVNRAFAVAMCRGARAGLDELDAIPERALVARYPYALATYAELHASLGELDLARPYLDRALDAQPSPAERALLRRKRDALG
jgi:RNA polymerase sigma-70 factor (ECF subfamily)